MRRLVQVFSHSVRLRLKIHLSVKSTTTAQSRGVSDSLQSQRPLCFDIAGFISRGSYSFGILSHLCLGNVIGGISTMMPSTRLLRPMACNIEDVQARRSRLHLEVLDTSRMYSNNCSRDSRKKATSSAAQHAIAYQASPAQLSLLPQPLPARWPTSRRGPPVV